MRFALVCNSTALGGRTPPCRKHTAPRGPCSTRRLKVSTRSAVVAEPHTIDDDAPSTSDRSGPAPVPVSAIASALASGNILPPLSFEHRPGVRDPSGRVALKNLTLPEMEEWCVSVGETPKRARQLYRWLYGNRKWIRNLDQADSDPQAFSAAFKAKVTASATLAGGLQLQSVHTARDGTRKLVFALVSTDDRLQQQQQQQQQQDGAEAPGGGAEAGAPGPAQRGGGPSGLATRGTVETVLIPMTNRSGEKLRYTACLSTQVGCAQNCQFCYTGRMGLLGNLTTAQIIEQVVEARRFLAEQDVAVPIANIVFMGMGEPLANYDAVMAAIEILAVGLELSRNKIIVSTVGLLPEMRRFIASRVAKLAVSLHATTDEVRNWIVPTNRRYPLPELLGALREAFPYDKRKGDDFVVIEYVLLGGVNDSPEDAARLLAATTDIYCLVNLIVFNPHEGTPFTRSTDEAVHAFRGVFLAAGRPCTLRTSKGDDSMAACGQLGDTRLALRPAPMLRPPEALAARLAAAPSPAVVAATAAAAL